MVEIDEYAGQGGSYLLDPKTGKRTLVERTAVPEPGQSKPQPVAPRAPAPKSTPTKGA